MSDLALKTARLALLRFFKDTKHQLLKPGKLELPASEDQYRNHPIEEFLSKEENIGTNDLINLLESFRYFHPAQILKI